MNRLRRTLLGTGVLALPVVLRAQPDRARTVGYLTPAATPSLRDRVFQEGLRERGWIEGRNLRYEYRRGGNDVARLKAMADELVRLKVDVLVAQSTPAVKAAVEATRDIPLVTISADPLGAGFVSNLARPGGNMTGVSMMMTALAPKRLELIREILPKVATVGFLAHGGDPAHAVFVREMEAAGKRLGVRIAVHVLQGPEELDGAFESMGRARIEALVIQPLWVNTLGLGRRIGELALARRIVTVCDGDSFAQQGGMLFLGPDPSAIYARLAYYVDRVLRGAKPGEMPIEQPSKFALEVNLKVAQALGVKVPQAVLLRADAVIE